MTSHLVWVGVCLGLADFVSSVVTGMLRHEDHVEGWESSFAFARFALASLCLLVVQPKASSPKRSMGLLSLVALLLVGFVLAPVLVHGRRDNLELVLAVCFAVAELLLLCVLAPQYYCEETEDKKETRDLGDLETQLLEEKRNEEKEEIDLYKGQGATFARLVSLSYPERYILTVATFALLVSSLTGLITPLLFGRFIQSINSEKQSMHLLNTTVLQMILLFIVSCSFSMMRGALFTLAGERLVARFRVRLFDHIIFQDITFFDTNQSGELQSRLSSDTTAIQNAVTVNVSMVLRMALEAMCSFFIIFFISWKLTLVMLSVVPVVGVIARLYGTFVRNLSKNYQDSLAKASETAEEAFSSIRTVRSFSKERFQIIAKYAERIGTSYEYGKQRAWAYGIFLGVIGLLASLAMCLVLWMGGRMVIKNEDGFTAANLTTFLMYTLNLAVALGGLSEVYGTLLSAVGSSERMFGILDLDPRINSRSGGGGGNIVTTPSSTRTSGGALIEFDHVTFAYETRKDITVLNDLSFQLVPQSVSAFVGSSGGGKSTICSLLQRYYDPNQGAVRIDGVSLKDMDPVVLRGRMSVVSQEPTLFATTIRDNIAFGAGDGAGAVSFEDICQAARRANAYDFIMSFKPDGFNTLVGERGVQLSGGQKQRIAIARAILKNPDILLLDEATSALDSESEHVVQQALDELMKDRTTVVIAHRLTTVRHASKIFVMSEGKIVEDGTYEQLLEQGGMFTALVSRQLKH
ncbi:hypothetical protein BASA81_005516 [Batrachochytrium salamandrivorans]|nr:hypothetical protein BASA81_005516 [Batrachochytrium salamandrivorans]